MASLILLSILAPVTAAICAAAAGWRAWTAVATVVSALVVLGCGIGLAIQLGGQQRLALGGLLRADALSATMLIVIGVVATLATWASVGYIDTELRERHTDHRGARLYGVLTPAFVAAMALAVSANDIGVICAFFIAIACVGTTLLYFAVRHTGADTEIALHLYVLTAHAAALDPGVTRLAGALLLIGYGAKVGLAPFHTWLADAHSQAPAPVSALMSGVLLSVAFSVLIRIRPIIDAAVGPGFLRGALLAAGLAAVLVAALLLTVTGDLKRMLAYSSMENMGLIAIAAAAGTKLAIAALLLHILAHGVGKTVLFLAGGQLQAAHGSTAICEITAVLGRSRLVGSAFAVGIIVLLGLPPFAMFASELSIARSLADARLSWALGLALLLIVVAFAALTKNSGQLLFGAPPSEAPAIPVPATVAGALLTGVVISAILGVTIGPLAGLFDTAAGQLGAR